MKKGFVTIPADATFVNGMKKYIEMWGADAIRDCDGVSLPDHPEQFNCEIYKAYFIVREDHEYCKKHPEYLQNVAIITDRHTAFSNKLEIDLLENLMPESIQVNEEDKEKYWQVYDRTAGKLHKDWEYLGNNIVLIKNT